MLPPSRVASTADRRSCIIIRMANSHKVHATDASVRLEAAGQWQGREGLRGAGRRIQENAGQEGSLLCPVPRPGSSKTHTIAHVPLNPGVELRAYVTSSRSRFSPRSKQTFARGTKQPANSPKILNAHAFGNANKPAQQQTSNVRVYQHTTYLGDGEAGEGNTGTGTRGLVHLPVHQGGLGALGGVLADLGCREQEKKERKTDTRCRSRTRFEHLVCTRTVLAETTYEKKGSRSHAGGRRGLRG